MQPAKRVNIVSLELVREGSVLYRERQTQSPEDAYQLLKPFLVDADRDAASVPVTSRRLSKIDRNRESLIGSLFLFFGSTSI